MEDIVKTSHRTVPRVKNHIKKQESKKKALKYLIQLSPLLSFWSVVEYIYIIYRTVKLPNMEH